MTPLPDNPWIPERSLIDRKFNAEAFFEAIEPTPQDSLTAEELMPLLRALTAHL